MIPPNKPRSRRLRKKLRVGEFQEWGFEFETELRPSITSAEENSLIDRFLSEIIDPRSLEFGGWITGGFVTACGRGSATDEDRKSVQDWLSACPEIKVVRVSQLIDAWHGF